MRDRPQGGGTGREGAPGHDAGAEPGPGGSGPTYRAVSRPATPPNTRTSSMFCFTRTAATPAAPARPRPPPPGRRDEALSAPTTPAIPTATNGAASSSPSTIVAPASGLTSKARSHDRGPCGRARSGRAASDVRRPRGPLTTVARHPEQPQRHRPAEHGREPEQGDQQGWPVHPVVAVQRGPARRATAGPRARKPASSWRGHPSTDGSRARTTASGGDRHPEAGSRRLGRAAGGTRRVPAGAGSPWSPRRHMIRSASALMPRT